MTSHGRVRRRNEATVESMLVTGVLAEGRHRRVGCGASAVPCPRGCVPPGWPARVVEPVSHSAWWASGDDVLICEVADQLVKQLDIKGTLGVLRQGFKFQGKTLRLAFFKPAHSLNPDAVKHSSA